MHTYMSFGKTIPQTAMKSKANKEKFGEQIKNIISSVEELLAKTNTKLSDEKGSLHSVNEKYMNLVERERAYHKVCVFST